MEKLADEVLMAYADGALSDVDRARVEAVLAADASQRERLAPFIITRAALSDIFSEALTSPVPDRLIDTVLTAPIGTEFRPKARATFAAPSWSDRLRDFLFPQMPSLASAFALSASVLLVAGAGWLAGHASRPDASPQHGAVALHEDVLVATGALQLALETAASNTPVERGLIKAMPVLTFRDEAGRFCRQYAVLRASKDPLAGFACRTAEGLWTIAYHAPADAVHSTSPGAIEPAAHAGVPALEAAIDKTIKGDQLTSKEEADRLAKGWVEGR